jgi:hypothetical protein
MISSPRSYRTPWQNVYDPGNGQGKVYKLEVIGDRVQFGAKHASQPRNEAQLALVA